MIGLLGGTFDPVHLGHLHVATAVAEALALDSVALMPANIPPHRDPPIAKPTQRLTMIELAIADHPILTVEPVELERPPPSYTIDTLKILRKRNPKAAYAFIIGHDAFLHFDAWLQYEDLLDYVHLIVVNRPETEDTPTPEWMTSLLEKHQVADLKSLKKSQAGHIYYQAISPMAISATTVRTAIAAHQDLHDLLPDAVRDYIHTQQLYL